MMTNFVDRSFGRGRFIYRAMVMAAAAALGLLFPASLHADTVWGIQSSINNGNPPVYSNPPTAFFSVDTTTNILTGYGDVTLNGQHTRLDGLAINDAGKAVGFVISDPVDGAAKSTLVQINGATVDATPGVAVLELGVEEDYFAAGAAYDPSGNLWVFDNVAGNLLKIDDSDGTVLSTTALSGLGYMASASYSTVDLAFDSTGTGYVVQNEILWTVNTGTGALTITTPDIGDNGWVGMAVDPGDDDVLYGFRTYGGADTLRTYTISTGVQVNLGYVNNGDLGGVTGREGGRGDLASSIADAVLPTPIQDPIFIVDRDTGNITFSNASGPEFTIVGYSLLSGREALDPSSWLSISQNYDAPTGSSPGDGSVDPDDEWFEETVSYGDLSEEVVAGDGATIVSDQTIDFGDGVWVPSYAEDVRLQLLLDTDEVLTVLGTYVGNGGEPLPYGDIAGGGVGGDRPDGTLDILDWQAFQAGYGTNISGMTVTEAYFAGDMTGDMDHTIADFVAFKEAYDDANGLGAFEAMVASIPEPSSALLAMLAVCACGLGRRIPGAARLTKIACVLVLLATFTDAVHAQIVWGTQIDTNNDNAPVYCDPSTAFFGVDTSTNTLTGYGFLTVNNEGVRLDGLAVSSTGKAVGYIISDPIGGTANSQLVQINGATIGGSPGVSANVLGIEQSYFATGAAYDSNDTLWVVDNLAGSLHQIDDTDGSIISTQTLFGTGYSAGASGNTVDLAFDSQGTGYLIQNEILWTVNTGNGALSIVTPDIGDNGWVGMAVDPADDDVLYGLRTYGGSDTLRTYTISTGVQVNLGLVNNGDLGGTTGEEGGRGDLASGSDSILATEQLTLEVNTITGEATLLANELFPIEVDSYRILSPSGSLDTVGWSRLADDPTYGDGVPDNGIGWEVLADAAGEITEANLTGSSLFTSAAPVSLGSLFSTGGTEDLVLEFSTVGGGVIDGVVSYFADGPDGDFDLDGDVDLADLLVWQRGFGSQYDASDLALWKANFDSGGSLSSGNVVGVPEPASCSILIMTLLVAGASPLVRPRRKGGHLMRVL